MESAAAFNLLIGAQYSEHSTAESLWKVWPFTTRANWRSRARKTSGGGSANRVARWDSSSWNLLGSGTTNYVFALTPCNSELTAGGAFTTAGNHVSAYWARWGPDCLRADMNFDGAVDALDVPLFVESVLAAPGLSVCQAYTANVNGDVLPDGRPRVDGLDVPAFARRLLGG